MSLVRSTFFACLIATVTLAAPAMAKAAADDDLVASGGACGGGSDDESLAFSFIVGAGVLGRRQRR